ncbi:hypothetical protein [Streptomyces sp. OE57]|uniref:hypothetical protein n=1 Tax=Streptomyces lacaronensis TaxID=3379885 RepID=UPI0039B75A19
MTDPVAHAAGRFEIAGKKVARLGFVPWAPVGAGELARPGGPVDRISSAHGATPSQVALAWPAADRWGHQGRSPASGERR